MKSILLLALLVVVLSIVSGCKSADTTTSAPKDSTSKAMKQAGGDD